MRIAGITITYNDDYKFNEWCQHYEEYKNDLYLHIIVDNGSDGNYLKKLKNYFQESVIIERTINGGCTGAYNDGIRYALSIDEIDSIALIANDIKLEQNALKKCYNFLFSDIKLGMVEPVILKKDTLIINDFGCKITKQLTMKSFKAGCNINDVDEKIHFADALTGGMNLTKREFYENIGLQDEKLFMYSDEIDMGIRAIKYGYKFAAIKDARAWHQHINPNNVKVRLPYTGYLFGRNKIYLAKKHFGCNRKIYVFIFLLWFCLKNSIKILLTGDLSELKYYRWVVLGAFNGLLGNMNHNNYSLPS